MGKLILSNEDRKRIQTLCAQELEDMGLKRKGQAIDQNCA